MFRNCFSLSSTNPKGAGMIPISELGFQCHALLKEEVQVFKKILEGGEKLST
jgi:hypothetical protein